MILSTIFRYGIIDSIEQEKTLHDPERAIEREYVQLLQESEWRALPSLTETF